MTNKPDNGIGALTLMEQLRVLRFRKRWSVRACAELLHIKPRTLYSWERGERKPATDACNSIRAFLRRWASE